MKKIALFVTTLMLLAAVALADAPAAPLEKVEPAKVCMINEQYMNRPQIPITVEGKTYYGCCDACKERLAKDATKRVATDPVSGKEVDKAMAVIGAAADGRVLYFENEKNLAKYNAGK